MPSLQSLWKEGREGALSPLEQMRAWALREAQKDLGGEEAVNHQKIADRVTKVGGGHPSREAIRKFLDRVDEDSDWYPGKNSPIYIYIGEGGADDAQCVSVWRTGTRYNATRGVCKRGSPKSPSPPLYIII